MSIDHMDYRYRRAEMSAMIPPVEAIDSASRDSCEVTGARDE